MNLPKTDDNDRTHKNDTNTLSCHMVNASFWASASYDTSNSSHFFFNFEDPVLVHTLYYRMKATYHPLLTGIFHEQISVQHVGHNVLHLHVVKRLSSH